MKKLRFRDYLIMAAAILLTLGIAVAQFQGGPGGDRIGPRGHGAQQHGPEGPAIHRNGGPFRAMGIVAEYLELDEGQVGSIREISQALREEAMPIRQNVRALKQELKAQFDSDTPDATIVGSLMIQIHEQREELRNLAQARNEAVLDLLSVEQAAKVNDVLEAAKLQPVIRAFHELKLLPPRGPNGPDGPFEGPVE